MAARADALDYTLDCLAVEVGGVTAEKAVRVFARELIRSGQAANSVLEEIVKKVEGYGPGVYVDRRRLARILLPFFREVWGDEDAVGEILVRGLATGDRTFF